MHHSFKGDNKSLQADRYAACELTIRAIYMRRLSIIGGSVFAALAAIIVYGIVGPLYFDACGISEQHARAMVLKHLTQSDPAAGSRLKYEDSRGTCQHSYYYKGPAGKLSFVVIDDFLHGPKVTSWDHARDNKNGKVP